MKMKLLSVIAASCCALLAAGCVKTLDGDLKPGVPFVKDTIESRYERPVDQIFAASKEVLAFNGTLTGENTISNTLEARIDTRTVFVTVDEVEPKITRVRVQARKKAGGADVALASEIDKQIALRIR